MHATPTTKFRAEKKAEKQKNTERTLDRLQPSFFYKRKEKCERD